MNHSFKLSKNLDNKNKTDYSLLFMIIFIILAVVFITMSLIITMKKSEEKVDVNVEKIIPSKDYVYTVEKQENVTREDEYDEIPYINLDGDKYKEINQEIVNNYQKLKNTFEYDYSYQYSISKNILSIIIFSKYIKEEGVFSVESYKSYNIDLSEDKVLSDDELLEKYKLTKENLNSLLRARFEAYYKDTVREGYYTEEECSYECFIKNRGLTPSYLDGVSLYVENNDLYAYKYFYKDSDYDEGKYFDSIDYKIVIVDKK